MTTNTTSLNESNALTTIEISHYRRLKATVIFEAILFLSIDLSFIWVFTMASFENPILDTLPFLLLFYGYFALIIKYIREMVRIVYRLEFGDGSYTATTIMSKKIVFQADEVSAILEGYAHIRLILSNGKKLEFFKTDRFSFGSRSIGRRDDHPWFSTINQKSFPKARYESKRVPW